MEYKQSLIQKYFFFTLGILLTSIGTIGIFLPLLPTTIFLILASYCFLRSSPKANEWLRNHKIFGSYIKNYQDKQGLTLKSKILNLIFLWTMIIFSMAFYTNELYIRIILTLIAVSVSVHIITIKNYKERENE